MAKKQKIKVRRRWRINPRSRIKQSNKRYRRSKAKSKLRKIIEKEVR